MPFIELPLQGSPYYGDPVATFADLPPADLVGTVRLVEDESVLYWFDGSTWNAISGGVASVADTDSIDLTVTAGVLTADLLLSDAAADANNQLVALDIVAGGGPDTPGLRGQIADADIRSTISASAPVAYDALTGVISLGVVPIADGGTNSSTALNNNRVMQSSGGAIVEAAAITAARALISDANGIPTQSVTTATELGYVSGVTSAIQTQLDSKVTGPASATDEAIARYNLTTGKLIQNSGVTIDDSNNILGANSLKVGASGAITASTTLEVAGTTGAFLLPRLNSTQRDALTGTNGMVIYNSTTDRPQCYVAGSWVDMIGWGN